MKRLALCLGMALTPLSHAQATQRQLAQAQVPPPPPSTTPIYAPPKPQANTNTGRDAAALIAATTPPIEELQDAALRRSTVDPRTTRRWLRRARAAAALPTVRGELDLRRDQAWQLDQEAGDADELSQDSGAGQVIRVRVAWQLDRLIFDPNELRAARAAVDMAMAREQVLLRVTQLYFERLQLLIEMSTSDPAKALQQQLRIREIEALLYGLCGLRVQTRISANTRTKLRSRLRRPVVAEARRRSFARSSFCAPPRLWYSRTPWPKRSIRASPAISRRLLKSPAGPLSSVSPARSTPQGAAS